MNTETSAKLFARARELMPGGVNSPVRAFKGVGGEPLFLTRGQGPRVWDADGNELLDYVGSWGPLILGHAHPTIVEAVGQAARNGTTFGAPTPSEVRMAEGVIDALPSLEMVRFVSSGTEATMSALRLARAATGRDAVIKFAGCYHGHSDGLLVQAGSGATTLGVPDSPGVPDSYASRTLIARYNDLDSVRHLLASHPQDVAAVIVEPIAGNMGVVLPSPGFLQGLRELTDQYRALLVFDEVITGFRVGPGGAQALYGVAPDITCLGKIVGGGLPVGAFGARRELMELVAPAGPVYQAGTLSGNPLAMAAGLATLSMLQQHPPYTTLDRLGAQLEGGLRSAAARAGVRSSINRAGSMLTLFFADADVTDYESAKRSDTTRYAQFFHAMLEQGVYLPPSQFEAWFISAAHTEQDIDTTLAAADAALQSLLS